MVNMTADTKKFERGMRRAAKRMKQLGRSFEAAGDAAARCGLSLRGLHEKAIPLNAGSPSLAEVLKRDAGAMARFAKAIRKCPQYRVVLTRGRWLHARRHDVAQFAKSYLWPGKRRFA